LVDASEVIPAEVQRDRCRVVLEFLLKAFVGLVKRRIGIRMVRFWRST
jgi:hypothetical protein